MGKDGKLKAEQEIESPDVLRMTPYEFALTAEPSQLLLSCAQPIQVPSSSIAVSIGNQVRLYPTSVVGMGQGNA